MWRRSRFQVTQSQLACLLYAASSTLVTILNKLVFSHAHFNFPWATLAFQNAVSVLCIYLARFFGYSCGFYSRRLARAMTVPLFFFIAFIFSNAQALRYLNLPVLTVWKSLGPMAVTLVEAAYFRTRFSIHVYLSMALIVLSAFVTAINDLEFSLAGYVWAFINLLSNVAYLISLRLYLTDPSTSSIDKTFHSNLLSLLFIIPMSFISRETPYVVPSFLQRSLPFQLTYIFSGVLTLAVCASAFWTITLTSGSTLSFIGGMNKLPIILLSLLIFDMQISAAGWAGVILGVFAGIVFVRAKSFSNFTRTRLQDSDDKSFAVATASAPSPSPSVVSTRSSYPTLVSSPSAKGLSVRSPSVITPDSTHSVSLAKWSPSTEPE